MSLSHAHKRLIRKRIRTASLDELSADLRVPRDKIAQYIASRWPDKKFTQAIKQHSPAHSLSLQIPDRFWPWLKQYRWHIGLLLILVIIAYTRSIPNSLVSDDMGIVVNKTKIESWTYPLQQQFMMLRTAIYTLTINLFGLTPWVLRVINIFFHAGSTVLVFLILALLVEPLSALFAAAIFAVHPLLSEAVMWISGGVYPQYTFFMLLSFFFYMLGDKHKKYTVWSVVSFAAVLLTSEKALIGAGVFFLFEVARGSLKANVRRLLPFAAVTLVVGVYFFGFGDLFGKRVSGLSVMNYESAPVLNPLQQIPVAISSYLELFLWPDKLAFYHSEMQFTPWSYALRVMVTLAFIAGAVYGYIRNRLVFFWLAFFVVSLLPFLTPFGISWIVAERYVYLGTVGLCAVFAYGIGKLYRKPQLKTTVIAAFCLYIAALSIRTIVRAGDWKDQDHLWIATARTSPSSHNNHNNLGDMYSRHGQLDKAIDEFKTAIALKPNYAEAYHNLGLTYEQKGVFDDAISNYRQAVVINPNLWQSYQHLAIMYYQQSKFDEAESAIHKAISIDPANADSYYIEGKIYLVTKQTDKAKEAFGKALTINPNHEKAQKAIKIN